MYAVLTGDIVGSTDLTPEELNDVMSKIEIAAFDVKNWPGVEELGFSRRAGDAWQIAIKPTFLSMRLTLYVF